MITRPQSTRSGRLSDSNQNPGDPWATANERDDDLRLLQMYWNEIRTVYSLARTWSTLRPRTLRTVRSILHSLLPVCTLLAYNDDTADRANKVRSSPLAIKNCQLKTALHVNV